MPSAEKKQTPQDVGRLGNTVLPNQKRPTKILSFSIAALCTLRTPSLPLVTVNQHPTAVRTKAASVL